MMPKDWMVEMWPEPPRTGMHVGMPKGVKVTHIPTGLVETCDSERSQHANRDKAIKALAHRMNRCDSAERASGLRTPLPSPDSWHPHTLLFTRVEGVEVTAIAHVELMTRELLDDVQTMAALQQATTEWVARTESGRDAWFRSSEDLNIGDLVGDGCFAHPDLQIRLEANGLRFVGARTGLGERSFHYDTVLVDIGSDPECERGEIQESSDT